MYVCICKGVTDRAIREQVASGALTRRRKPRDWLLHTVWQVHLLRRVAGQRSTQSRRANTGSSSRLNAIVVANRSHYLFL